MGGQANTPVPSNNSVRVRTTNQGADNITNAQYAAFLIHYLVLVDLLLV